MKAFAVSFLFVIALVLGYSTNAHAEECVPHHWTSTTEVLEDGTVVEHWTNGCESHDTIVSTPIPTPVVTETPAPTATPEPTVVVTPEPTIVVTVTEVAPTTTPEPTVVVTPEPTTVVSATITPEPTQEWIDIVVVPTATLAVVDSSVQIISVLPEPTPTVQPVDSSTQEVASGLTSVTTRTWTVENTTVVEVAHPTFTEVYSITQEGVVTRDVRDSIVHAAPVTGGEEAPFYTQLAWLVEDGLSDLDLAWLVCALLLITMLIAAVVCAIKRIINSK